MSSANHHIAGSDGRLGALLYDLGHPGPQRAWQTLVATVLVAAPIYGAVMGGFALDSVARLLMVLFAALKMPLLLFATAALCLPGFVVLSTILDLRQDLPRSLRAILTGQAAMTLSLASLAPLTAFAYTSGVTHSQAIIFNAVMFTIATALGQVILWRQYRPLLQTTRRHFIPLWSWLVMYAFVGVQMGWMLRPFIGVENQPITFFREEPFSNAYVEIARLLVGGH